MSVNKVVANNGQITLQGDYVTHHQKDVSFELEGSQLPDFLKGDHKGDMFITNLRLIFVNKGSNGYKTFSMEFQFIRNFEVKQPLFGSNHLKGFIKSEPNGGWEGNATFKIDFPKGGAIDFAEKFQRAVKDSARYRHTGMAPPPPMQPMQGMYPMGGAPVMPQQPMMYQQPMMPQQPMMQQQPMYYPPPAQGYYAYQPGMPPQGGQQPAYQTPTGMPPPAYTSAAETSGPPSKAQEAYMSGNTAYVPTEPPPAYNPHYKPKDQ